MNREFSNKTGIKGFHSLISLSARLSPITRRIFSLGSFVPSDAEKSKLSENSESQEGFTKNENFLIVCNHGSYLDILILYSVLKNPCFITSKDMQDTFFPGVMTRYSNCYALERHRKNRLKEDIKSITDRLLSGQNVVLFPEGTTGDGEKLLKFKSPIFDSAFQAKKKTQPVCLNYLSIDGNPLNGKNKDRVFWYGGSSFLKHFIGLCQTRRLECEMVLTSPLPPEETNRRELALKARRQIAREFKAVVSKSRFSGIQSEEL